MGSGDSGPTPNYMTMRPKKQETVLASGRGSPVLEPGSYTGADGKTYNADGKRTEIRNGKELVLIDPNNQGAMNKSSNQSMNGATSAKQVAATGGTAVDEALRLAQEKLDKEIADQAFKQEDQMRMAQGQSEISKQKSLRLKAAKANLYGPYGQAYSNPSNTKTILGA